MLSGICNGFPSLLSCSTPVTGSRSSGSRFTTTVQTHMEHTDTAMAPVLQVQFPLWNIPVAAAQTPSLAALGKQAQCCRCALCGHPPSSLPCHSLCMGWTHLTLPQAYKGQEEQFFLYPVIFQLTKGNQIIFVFSF